jgi:hypothetical protein
MLASAKHRPILAVDHASETAAAAATTATAT